MKQYKFDSPMGPLYLLASEKGLCGMYFKKQKAPFVDSLNEDEFLKEAVKELKEYFSGKRKTFDLVLDFQGTDFQNRVWKELLKIPYGKTISYKELAQRIKKEKASRAVGTANGKNPLSIFIPCHRVIASNGELAGYAGGVSMKKKLLELETNLFHKLSIIPK